MAALRTLRWPCFGATVAALGLLASVAFLAPQPAAAVAFAQVNLPAPAPVGVSAPSAGLGIEGVVGDYTVQPGDLVTHTMQISLGRGATAPLDVLIDARGLGQTLDGSTVGLTADQDTNRQSARPFFRKIDQTSLHLEPGTTTPVTATFAIPEDAEPGTRYADVYIHTQPTGADQVGVILAANVPIILTVSGGEPPSETAAIISLDVKPPVSGTPIKITTVAQNTGNHHYKLDADVTLRDPNGREVAHQIVPHAGSSLLPAFSRQYVATFNLLEHVEGLPAGTYTVEVTMRRADGRLLDSRTTTLQLATPYQPFADVDPASVVVRTYQDEVPDRIDARREADVELTFGGTGRVTGTVVIARLRKEPASGVAFAASVADGGMARPGHKYIGIGVQGFNQGTAQATLYYRDPEVEGLSPNSLFLALRGQDRWAKLDGQQVFPGAQNLRGDLAVPVLNNNPIIGLGGDSAPVEVAGAQASSVPYIRIALALLAGLALGVSVVLYVTRRRGVETKAAEGSE